MSKLCSVTSSNGRNSLSPAFTNRPSRCPNSRLIVANIVSRSTSLLTSARTARLPAPSVPLAACSVLSFKPQMATRAPSRSNSCAVASPIPLLPPVIRIFLSASLPIVVTPCDQTCPWRLQFLATFECRSSNRSQHDPLVRSPAAKIKQWLAFARCPIRVAQGISNVLWPMAFRRRQAQHAGRQTVEDSGKDGATFSERCHFKPMEEIPALHNRRTVNQPGCEDWHLKCRRIDLSVGRQCPIDQQTTTRREMQRNRRSGPAGDAIDRPR